MSLAATGLMSFEPFSRLPRELQLTIWETTVPEPRVIKVKISSPCTVFDKDYVYETAQELAASLEKAAKNLILSTDNVTSGLLGACKTSQEVILMKYKVKIPLTDGKVLRFDGDKDTILLYSDSCNAPLLPGYDMDPGLCPDYQAMFSGVKNLAFLGYHDTKKAAWALSHFSFVEKVGLVIPLTRGYRSNAENLRLMDLEEVFSSDLPTFDDISSGMQCQDELVQDWKNCIDLQMRARNATKWTYPRISLVLPSYEILGLPCPEDL